ERTTNHLSVTVDSVSSSPEELTVTYSSLPFSLRRTYSTRSIVLRNDSLDKKKKRVIVTQSEGVFNNMFGPELNKSGSISRGFMVGSNRDLTLSSGFRLQMSGKLSDEIDILAALTDENTPIQPQGNTQTLQEIDNVFVQIKSPTYTATLGDFQFSARSGEFVNINRKLQGADLMAEYRWGTLRSNVQMTGATSRGKFNSNSFQGIEGVQGPYRLTGKNNERAIIIIAGSEKVYVDGEPMLRGDNNDYSIDYGSAEVTFSTRKLITGASRIVVDFEYADRQYTRNFIGFNSSTEITEAFTLRANYFRESDDPDAPIDISLTESDKLILRAAGNSTAVKSGIVLVGTDSLGIGKGNYRAVDTLMNGIAFTFYRYEVGTTAALYNVAFTYVGQGKGDYLRESVGRYRFAGVNGGQYAPVILLPTPQLHQVYSFQTTVHPVDKLTINAEYAASSFDQNRFSPIGDGTMNGGAFSFQAQFQPDKITIAGTDIGRFDIAFSERLKQDRFLAFDRTDLVEFGRKWSTDSLSSGRSANEEIREGKLQYMPTDEVTFSTSAGTLVRTGEFSSVRYDGSVNVNEKTLPKASYYIENISGDDLLNNRTNDWFRQKGSVEYSFNGLMPSLRYENEVRKVQNSLNDSLEQSSYSFNAVTPKISAENILGMDASTELEVRNDRTVSNGSLVPQSNSITQNYALTLREVRNFSFSTLLTLREKRFEKIFQSNNTNQQTTLLKVQSRYRPFSQGLDVDLLYDAATQRTAKLERYFYKVRKGEGQYIWIDANNNGVADLNDEREFRPDRYDGDYIAITLNSDNLIPIINLKASSRIRINPSRFIQNPGSLIERMLTVLSSETFARIEERSTEPNTSKIYLLKFGSFLNPATTQLGVQFLQQDLFLFEYNPEYSFRFRFNQRNALSQFSSGQERNYARERSLRSRFQLSNDMTNQTDLIMKNDNAVSSSAINQSRAIESLIISTDLSYRPVNNIEIGIQLETNQSQDHHPGSPVTADFNGQTVRLVYGFLGNGQIRSEISREEILISGQPSGYSIPYELTAGRDIGKNFLWSAGADYRLNGNVQFSLQYSGRTTSRSQVVHTGRMEVRAFF
ncbi:MAG: hypothetical protein ACOYNS_17025, partial [Bacteroidota bacterium]